MTEYIKINELTTCSTARSPFEVYPDERIVTDEIAYPRSLCLTDLDKATIVVVARFKIMTSRMLLMALEQAKMENINQRELQIRLHQLCCGAYLQSSRFVNADGTYAASKYYTLSYRGRGFLRSIGIEPHLSHYIANMEPAAAKRHLSVNQYLIGRTPFHSVEVGKMILSPANEKERAEDIFRAYGLVQDGNNTLIVDSIRRNKKVEDWRAYLVERLQRMDKTLSSKKCNITLKNKGRVVLIADSYEHLKEINELLKCKDYKSFELLLTCDQLTYSQPERCLVEREKKAKFGLLSALFTAVY